VTEFLICIENDTKGIGRLRNNKQNLPPFNLNIKTAISIVFYLQKSVFNILSF
jgi:hypothetical protein